MNRRKTSFLGRKCSKGIFLGIAGASLLVAGITHVYADNVVKEETAGYVLAPQEKNVPVHKSSNAKIASSIPSSYMNDISVLKSTYPKSRDQGEYGTCWAFSTIAMAEFGQIKNGKADKSIDLSELALAYFTFNSVNDPLGGIEGDTTKYVGYDNYLVGGGNYIFAGRRLANWQGPVRESLAPYSKATSVLKNGLPSEYAYKSDELHLENMYVMNPVSERNEIKKMIMKYGAVGSQYYSSVDSNYYKTKYAPDGKNSQTVYTYNYPNYHQADHAITIVGWDDNFSKSKFKNNPSKNGAWLVRNSWAESTDEEFGSYFWISYYDSTMVNAAVAMEFNSKNNYDNNYQYDGGTTVVSADKSKVANIFKVKSSSQYGESLKAIGISCLSYADMEYTIKVYTDLTDVMDPYSGIKIRSQSGTTTHAGMYTVKLDKAVKLNPGTTYSVVVECVNGGYIDKEETTDFYDDMNKIASVKVTAKKGQSFYWSSSKWNSQTKGNYCIKSFTNNNSSSSGAVPAKPKLNSSVSGNDIKLKWDSVSCDQYVLEMAEMPSADPGKCSWKKVYEGTKANYTVKNCEKGKMYIFRVRACRNKIYSSYGITKATLGLGSITAKNGSGEVDLKWNKASGASGYDIMRKTDDGSYKKILSISTGSINEYQDYSVSNGKKYTYKIIAKIAGNLTMNSSEKKLYFVKPVSIKSISSSYRNMKIEWKSNSGGDGYEIEYSKKSDMSGAKKVKVQGKTVLSKNIKNLTKGSRYYVRIRVTRSSSNSAYSSKKSVIIK